MNDVLLVEDNPVEQFHNKRWLEDNVNARVVTAGDGFAALKCLTEKSFDLVITDLKMPKMDGLALLYAISEKYSQQPVVALTGSGSEAAAVAALRAGAVGYIRKTDLERDLSWICKSVFSKRQSRQRRASVVECAVRGELDFQLSNSRSLAAETSLYLQELAQRIVGLNQIERTRLGVAIEEALINAIVHGNLEIESSVRERDHSMYEELIKQRQASTPYASRTVSLRFQWTPSTIAITIRDQGSGFDPSILADPRTPENLVKSSGRGILLMRTFMDDVNFNAQGNQVTLFKQINADRVEQAPEAARHEHSALV